MFTVAKVTFQEMIRERLIHVVIFIALLLFLFSLLLGSLSFDEQTRIVIHLGLAAIQLSIVGISIFAGVSLISNEIERQTCLIVLSRPISRAQFYIGKFIGASLINLVICILLCTFLWFFSGREMSFEILFMVTFGSFLESLILLAFSMFLSISMRTAVSLFASIGIFIIGNWLEELVYFAKKSNNQIFELFASFIHNFTPQLYRTNWRSYHLIQNHLLSGPIVQGATIHAVGWTLCFICMGVFIFRRKDLV